MHPALRILGSVVAGMFLGVSVGFLLVPDPTGFAPLVAGPVLGLVFTVAIYLQIGDEADSSATT